jgi:transcriptional adapter 2-alpha
VRTLGLGNWTTIAEKMGLNHSLDGCRRHYIECYCSRNGSFGIYIPAKVLSLDNKQAEDGGSRPNKAPLAGITEQSSSGDTKIEFRGYLPLRGDFDVEYDNDAEGLVAEMEVGSHDNDAEIPIKKYILKLYNDRLLERNRRKLFAINSGLLETLAQPNHNKTTKRPREKSKVASHMRAFTRFRIAQGCDMLKGLDESQRLRQCLARFD